MRPAGGGLPVLDGGVDVVFDCRASALSIDLAVRLLRAGGTLVLCGRSGRHEIEWSLIWARELTVRGAASYGREPDGRRTFGTIREWLERRELPGRRRRHPSLPARRVRRRAGDRQRRRRRPARSRWSSRVRRPRASARRPRRWSSISPTSRCCSSRPPRGFAADASRSRRSSSAWPGSREPAPARVIRSSVRVPYQQTRSPRARVGA